MLGQTLFKGGEINSKVRAQVLHLPLNATLPSPVEASVNIIISNIPSGTVPWWVYLLAGLGGLLLLLIIVLILWKCGYFKRKRVETADETEDAEKDMKDKSEEEEEHPTTPQSPMLKEMEKANDDFTFSRPESTQPV